MEWKLNLSPELKWYFITSVIASFTVIFLTAFEWSIIDRITPFLYMPLWAIVWIFFIFTFAASIVCFLKWKRLGIKSLLPLSVSIATFIIIYIVPFTDIWLKIDFERYKKERNEIVQKIYNSELKPNVDHNPSLIALGKNYPYISAGGNEIVTKGNYRSKYVFFFTYRGVLDNYSGFLYVPEDRNAKNFLDLNENNSSQIIHFEKNWYYVSHH